MIKDLEKRRQYQKEWARRDRLKYPKKYRKTDQAKYKKRRSQTPEKFLKTKREWERKSRAENPERYRARQREWTRKDREKNPEKYREKVRAYRRKNRDEKDPLKVSARNALFYAVANGKIVKPEICSECKSSGSIHGHHEDYNKPLEVDWLCSVCHGKRHRTEARV